MRKQKDWKEVALQQAQELGQLRAMLVTARKELQNRMRRIRSRKRGEGCEGELHETLTGIVQLTQMQMKVVPLEQDLLRAAEEAQGNRQGADTPLSDEDWKLLQDVMMKRARKVLRSATSDRTGIDGGQ